VDDSSRLVLDQLNLSAKIISVPDWDNGYIQQQWVKLNADRFIDSDMVMFVDSDCVFHTPFSPESYMKDGLPILMKTKYGSLGGAESWRGYTQDHVGFPVEYEYMRRLPWMYLSSSLKNFRDRYPTTGQYLADLKTREFSEFNVLGAYIDRYEQDNYYITDTEVWMPESVCKQFWSWGGLTPDIESEIKAVLK